MLSSLKSHEEDDQEPPTNNTLNIPNPSQYVLATSSSPRQILIRCAELIHRGNFPAALPVASLLLSNTSPRGDSSDRVAYHFAQTLVRLIESNTAGMNTGTSTTSSHEIATRLIQSSYLSFNQITPFLRFVHLTANQAILEAIEGHRGVHIIDMESAHGLQWPPLLQAIAGHAYLAGTGPPSIRITGAGTDIDALRRTGDRLHAFAQSLGLSFQFNPLFLPSYNLNSSLSSLMQLHQSGGENEEQEVLIVNCVLFVNKLLNGDGEERRLREFLMALRAMGPKVLTVAERELGGYQGAPQDFFAVFSEVLEYYSAVFDALEATVPPNSVARREVEEMWLRQEIERALVPSERALIPTGLRLERWETVMRESGFAPRQLSEYSLSQARLLLRLHYPSEGYQLQVVREALFLGWQARALFSVSSWK
ncbi:hypothetical protein LUZ60_017064 [Juncus effusus]|nr:hypothetical protein LUZ60_017064 [Juncus effusus]